eukprot:999829-Prorocentrum_minimum.AAC.2
MQPGHLEAPQAGECLRTPRFVRVTCKPSAKRDVTNRGVYRLDVDGVGHVSGEVHGVVAVEPGQRVDLSGLQRHTLAQPARQLAVVARHVAPPRQLAGRGSITSSTRSVAGVEVVRDVLLIGFRRAPRNNTPPRRIHQSQGRREHILEMGANRRTVTRRRDCSVATR